jgi:hypothetical protein
LNRSLRGWANYFEVGTVTKAYRALDNYTREAEAPSLASSPVLFGHQLRDALVESSNLHGFSETLTVEHAVLLALRSLAIDPIIDTMPHNLAGLSYQVVDEKLLVKACLRLI